MFVARFHYTKEKRLRSGNGKKSLHLKVKQGGRERGRGGWRVRGRSWRVAADVIGASWLNWTLADIIALPIINEHCDSNFSAYHKLDWLMAQPPLNPQPSQHPPHPQGCSGKCFEQFSPWKHLKICKIFFASSSWASSSPSFYRIKLLFRLKH